jgi:hypothetical protein
MRAYYQDNKDKWQRTPEQRARINQRRRERYATDPIFREECKRLSKLRDGESVRDYRLRKEFGITAGEYDTILELQDGRCAICRSEFADGRGHRLHVDHCHDTGRVRGILCGNCNLGLGKFQDDPVLLGRAINYLLGRTA